MMWQGVQSSGGGLTSPRATTAGRGPPPPCRSPPRDIARPTPALEQARVPAVATGQLILGRSSEGRGHDQPDQDNADGQGGEAGHPREVPHPAGGRIGPEGLEPPLGPEPLLFGGVLPPELLLLEAAREDHRVHRELLGTEVDVEEVDREDEGYRQERLVAVDEDGHVEDPAGQVAREEGREPEG